MQLGPNSTWLVSLYNKRKKLGHTDTRDASTPRKEQVRTQREGNHLQAKKRGRRRNQTYGHLNLEIQTSRNKRNTFLFFKPSSLWYFVMAALNTSIMLQYSQNVFWLGQFFCRSLTEFNENSRFYHSIQK